MSTATSSACGAPVHILFLLNMYYSCQIKQFNFNYSQMFPKTFVRQTLRCGPTEHPQNTTFQPLISGLLCYRVQSRR